MLVGQKSGDFEVQGQGVSAVWGGYRTLGGSALLKEVHHWEWPLRDYSLT